MYSSINANVKLGMAVEAVRLQEIRQQIEAQRVADEIKSQTVGSDYEPNLTLRWLVRVKACLMLTDQKRRFTPFVWKLLWYPTGQSKR